MPTKDTQSAAAGSNLIIETQDGSHSVFSEEYQVSYHSKYGAVQETQHVFIEAGLYCKLPELTPGAGIRILEFGFGTGLNAYMTLLEAERRELDIHYVSLEAFPVTTAQARQLNYPACLEVDRKHSQFFLELHECDWEQEHRLTPHFVFRKHLGLFQDYIPAEKFDIIYYDAFAPGAQPELWEAAVLQKAYDALDEGGIIVTYCAKGAVKRTLKSLGFAIEALPGPPGKREMTRGRKIVVVS